LKLEAARVSSASVRPRPLDPGDLEKKEEEEEELEDKAMGVKAIFQRGYREVGAEVGSWAWAAVNANATRGLLGLAAARAS
jgi:hypothetical protein